MIIHGVMILQGRVLSLHRVIPLPLQTALKSAGLVVAEVLDRCRLRYNGLASVTAVVRACGWFLRIGSPAPRDVRTGPIWGLDAGGNHEEWTAARGAEKTFSMGTRSNFMMPTP